MPLPPQRPPARPGGGALDPLGRQAGDALADECQKLEEELEALKAKYEMYFLGVERREPIKWREDLKKKVLRIKGAFTRNTGLRFRIQALHARYLSYERLWLRAAREKEEGTYRRDVLKARLHSKDAPPAVRAVPTAIASASLSRRINARPLSPLCEPATPISISPAMTFVPGAGASPSTW